MKPEECILFSGAAGGAEAEFGSCAERHGVQEVNFSFDGHNDARKRGVRVLTSEELRQGEVSLDYVGKLMGRLYPNTPYFRHVFQTLWHQVNNGQEIYVVGTILKNGTVKGGTGWGAEFAKLCNKPVFVFDQARGGWHRWNGHEWTDVAEPVIQHAHFAGTGTRFLEDAGRQAIRELFTRSFGAA